MCGGGPSRIKTMPEEDARYTAMTVICYFPRSDPYGKDTRIQTEGSLRLFAA
jgi:hypothetical protein